MEINNRKAYFDYQVLDTFECGVVLKGTEIKSIRLGKANIRDSYGIIKDNELFVLNMHISHYDKGNINNHEETRTRKLLMHKREIVKIENRIKLEGLTLVPLKVYFKKNIVKILLGLVRGKKLYDKRRVIKERDIKRETDRELKDFTKNQ